MGLHKAFIETRETFSLCDLVNAKWYQLLETKNSFPPTVERYLEISEPVFQQFFSSWMHANLISLLDNYKIKIWSNRHFPGHTVQVKNQQGNEIQRFAVWSVAVALATVASLDVNNNRMDKSIQDHFEGDFERLYGKKEARIDWLIGTCDGDLCIKKINDAVSIKFTTTYFPRDDYLSYAKSYMRLPTAPKSEEGTVNTQSWESNDEKTRNISQILCHRLTVFSDRSETAEPYIVEDVRHSYQHLKITS